MTHAFGSGRRGLGGYAVALLLSVGCAEPEESGKEAPSFTLPSSTEAEESVPEPTVTGPETPAEPPATPSEPPAPAVLSGKACTTKTEEWARVPNARSEAPAFYPRPWSALFARDLNGDANADVLLFDPVPNERGEYLLRFFAGTGARPFAAPVETRLTLPQPGPEWTRMGDVDGNGRADFLVGYTTNYPRSSMVYLWLQNEDGTFRKGTYFPDVSRCAQSQDERFEAVGVLDVDRDGSSDLLVTVNVDGLGGAPSGLTLLPGSSGGLKAGRCAAGLGSSTTGFPSELAIAQRLYPGDFDGDGQVDLAAKLGYSVSQLRLFRADGASNFVPMGSSGRREPSRFLFVDHLPSRRQDHLVAADLHSQEMKLSRISFDPKEGLAASVPIATVPQGYGTSVGFVLDGFSISDFNADGMTDILVLGNHEYTRGPAPFSLVCDRGARWDVASGHLPEATEVLAAADFDGDGRSELVARLGLDLVIYRFVD